MKKSPFGFESVKVVAISVLDLDRAVRFYGETLGLEGVSGGAEKVGFLIGETIIMLKEGFYAPPSELPNPRITLAVTDARATAEALLGRGVVIRDPVETYDDGYNIGSFLDSEGNKFWFCSPV
jgi:catechol 2,3-dioxygenase-like lactoylglutathione lyase family enzyme